METKIVKATKLKIVKCSWCGSAKEYLIPCGKGKAICTYCYLVSVM